MSECMNPTACPVASLASQRQVIETKRGRPCKVNPGSDVSWSECCASSQAVAEKQPLRRGPARKCKTGSSVTPLSQPAQPHAAVPTTLIAPPGTYQSAIARHLVENELCRAVYDDRVFRVLCRGRTKRHLEILEAIFIHTHAPELCTQKQQLAPLTLFRTTVSK